MTENRVQRIEQSPISIVSKRIDSISFDCGAAEQGQSSVRGKFNITNSITNKSTLDGVGQVISANVHLSIEPDEGFGYYKLELSVSGIFSKNSAETNDSDFEKAVLSDGISELYSFAKAITSTIVDGGAFGDVKFPILRIGF